LKRFPMIDIQHSLLLRSKENLIIFVFYSDLKDFIKSKLQKISPPSNYVMEIISPWKFYFLYLFNQWQMSLIEWWKIPLILHYSNPKQLFYIKSFVFFLKKSITQCDSIPKSTPVLSQQKGVFRSKNIQMISKPNICSDLVNETINFKINHYFQIRYNC